MTQTYTCLLFFQITKQNHLDQRAGRWTTLPSFSDANNETSEHSAQSTKHQPSKQSLSGNDTSQQNVSSPTKSPGFFYLSILWFSSITAFQRIFLSIPAPRARNQFLCSSIFKKKLARSKFVQTDSVVFPDLQLAPSL